MFKTHPFCNTHGLGALRESTHALYIYMYTTLW